MVSHRRSDDDVSAPQSDDPTAEVARSHTPDEPDADGPDTADHFGLFDGPREHGRPRRDRHAHESHAGAEDSDDAVDLTHLKEVLAGRRKHTEPPDPPPAATAPSGKKPKRRHRVRSTLIAIIVMVLIAGGAVAGVLYWQRSTAAPTDWAGTGSHAVIVRIQSGDGLYDVGQTLAGAGVVASAKTFVAVASDDGRLSALQPGFYRVHEHSSSQVVVNELADPANRLGQLRIIPGQTLADTTVVSTSGKKTTKQGIISAITAACEPTDGSKQCFSTDELWKVEETASLSDLGVVGWAVSDVAHAPDPRRRLEGMILPGDYVIKPGSTAQQALAAVVQASAAGWNNTTIVAAAKSRHMSPYQLATVASLVQAEGSGPDMPKVARVIYNRLSDGMKLQFDSTVNYGLGRAQISTTEAERLDADNLYSTYAHTGLTPTPIGAPGPTALDAADDPATGSWLYFVAIDSDGNTCFSTTPEEHEECVAQARKNGVFG